MPDLATAILGAIFALVVREAIDARKLGRQQRRGDDGVVRSARQELVETRQIAEHNLRALEQPEMGGLLREGRTTAGVVIDPLLELPTRLENLLRQPGPDDLLRNSEVIAGLSKIVTASAFLNNVDRERMRFIASQNPDRLSYTFYSHDEIAKMIDSKEHRLIHSYHELLGLIVEVQNMVSVIASDRETACRSRICWRGGYAPDSDTLRVLSALAEKRRLYRESLGSSVDAAKAFAILEHFGLARADEKTGAFEPTLRGIVMAGSGNKRWYVPSRSDPAVETLEWAPGTSTNWHKASVWDLPG